MESMLSSFDDNANYLIKQWDELNSRYPSLQYQVVKKTLLLRGALEFTEELVSGFPISGCYIIEIEIPDEYPDVLPIARELGGRINYKFGHVNIGPDQVLCLGTYLDQYIVFNEDKTLLNYVSNLLVPYLYAHEYWLVTGVMPDWGERSHGDLGILESCRDLFKTNDLYVMLRLLSLVVDNSFNEKVICPCGSQKLIRNCCADRLRPLFNIPTLYLNHTFAKVANAYFKRGKKMASNSSKKRGHGRRRQFRQK